MALHKILQATEPRGEAVLRRKSSKVKRFDQDLARLADDMFESMHAANGAGLSAVQIGVLQRVFIAELPPIREKGEGPPQPAQRFVLCNPEMVQRSEERQIGEEGCLSLAGWYAQLPRAQAVEVRYQDLQGRRRRMHAQGFLARVLQHEMDHLEGVLFTDRVEDLSTLVRVTADGEEAVPLEKVPARPDA